MELLVILLSLTLSEALTKINNEFNSNVFDDDLEYGLTDDFNDEGMEHFFRQIRSLEEDYKNVETIDTEEYYRKVPKSEFAGRLREMNAIYQNDDDLDFDDQSTRYKRSPQNNIEESTEKKQVQDLVDNGEKPLEIIVLNISNDTENGLEKDDALKINDFIRFKRDIHDENATKMIEDDKSRLKRERDDIEAKRNAEVKEQWIKQAYPVARDLEHRFDDVPRTPRVNFITNQRRSESVPLPVYYNYEPNYRYTNYPDDYDKGYYSRFPRHYQTYPDPYHRNYYRDESSRHPESVPYNRDENVGNYYNERPVYKQRRIIYYATLPEVVRSPPPTGDLGDRYNYRGSYESDDRFHRIPSQNVQRVLDPYRFRKPFPADKSRYDESGPIPVKGTYPLKVQTDVNVKEIKKNPERRIYSEGDHRYNREPYQSGGDRY